jgi:hypothetical protein
LQFRALAHEKLGQLLEAKEVYSRIVAQDLGAGAPSAFKEAQADAKKSIESLETRIPRLEIVLVNAPANTRVTLDGKLVEATALAKPFQMNPGKHALVIEPPGMAKQTRELDLKEGATEKVNIDLAPPLLVKSGAAASSAARPNNTAATTSAAPMKSTGPAGASPVAAGGSATEPGRGSSMLGPGIAFGVGGVGLIVGAVTGAMTFANAAEIRDLCGEDLICRKDLEGEVDLEGRKGIGYVSTAAFAVAGVGALVGTLLLVLSSGKKKEPVRAAVTLSPGFVGVKGAF